MEKIALEAAADQVSAELLRRGVNPAARVHVSVEILDPEPFATALAAEAGGAFVWLADEPDLYSDADLTDHAR